MNMAQLKSINQSQNLLAVNFIESGHSPMVIEVEYRNSRKGLSTALIKDRKGKMLTLDNIAQAYDLCRSNGIHKANLVQVNTDDEASSSSCLEYHKVSMPLVF
ncbi:MAG: hypothetical protein V7731_06875 [Amphritea sp.]